MPLHALCRGSAANGIPASNTPAAIGIALLAAEETAAGRNNEPDLQEAMQREDRESRQAANRAAVEAQSEAIERRRLRDEGLAAFGRQACGA